MESALRQILAVAGPGADPDTFPWERLRHEHTAAIRAAVIEKYAPRTANKIIAALKGVLKACWRQQIMSDSDYHHAIDLKSVSTTSLAKTGRLLSPDEVRSMVATMAQGPSGAHDVALIIVLFSAGLRRAEACSLCADDYDPKTGGLVIWGKGGKERAVYLPTNARARFEAWWNTRIKLGADTPVFLRWGKRGPGGRLWPDEVNAFVRRIAQRTGIVGFKPHDFRRTFATTLLDTGVDITVVRDLMGHSNVNTTANYDRRGEETKKKAAEKLPDI